MKALTPPLKTLAQLLKQKSQSLNLFSAQDRKKLETKHFPDALEFFEVAQVKSGMKCADIGTGGGIPGLVIGAAEPHLKVTLVDSTKKKLQVLEEILNEYPCPNTQTLWGRFEELAHDKKYREQFDFVTARAVAELPTLLEYAAGFLKKGGLFIAWKNFDFEGELSNSEKAQKTLKMKHIKSHPYSLPTGEGRVLLIFQKEGPLAKIYPRGSGTPSKKPL
ncbi:MAG: 16S rRNA (guanine(527)-N(7))-methyltransferase RsmG [Patescibacteria group bacterium]